MQDGWRTRPDADQSVCDSTTLSRLLSCRSQETGSIQASFLLRVHLSYLYLSLLSNGLLIYIQSPNHALPAHNLHMQQRNRQLPWENGQEAPSSHDSQCPTETPHVCFPSQVRHQSRVAHIWAHCRPSLPSPGPTSFTLHIPVLTPLDPSPDSDLLDPSGFQPWPSNPAPWPSNLQSSLPSQFQAEHELHKLQLITAHPGYTLLWPESHPSKIRTLEP